MVDAGKRMDDRTLVIYTVRDAETALGTTIHEDEFLSLRKMLNDGLSEAFVELVNEWKAMEKFR
jgi:hypothetical protein